MYMSMCMYECIDALYCLMIFNPTFPSQLLSSSSSYLLLFSRSLQTLSSPSSLPPKPQLTFPTSLSHFHPSDQLNSFQKLPLFDTIQPSTHPVSSPLVSFLHLFLSVFLHISSQSTTAPPHLLTALVSSFPSFIFPLSTLPNVLPILLQLTRSRQKIGY